MRPQLQITPKPAGAFSVEIAQRAITPAIVPPPIIPVVLHVIPTELNQLAQGKAKPATGIVIPGMVSLVATRAPLARGANTYAHSAAPLLTSPSSATLLHNLLAIKTPFIPDKWERSLNNITPFNIFSDVPIGMCFGFDMGVHTPPSYTYTPPNHKSALLYPDHVLSLIHNELSFGRYSGPFSQSRLEFFIGPFRTSPLGTVPKTVSSLEHRIVQDLSFPRNNPNFTSVNDQINIDDFRCDWGTFNEVRNIVINVPEGSEAATLDVDSAFRCCPITPSQQCNFIVHWVY